MFPRSVMATLVSIGNHSWKIISTKRNTNLTWDVFVWNDDLSSCIWSDFLKTALLLERLFLHASSEWLLQHKSYFLGVVIFSDQLLFLMSFLSRAVTFPQQLFFQNSYFIRAKLLSSSHFLRIGSCLGQ